MVVPDIHGAAPNDAITASADPAYSMYLSGRLISLIRALYA